MKFSGAALDGLGGVPEWKGPGASGWNQAAIDRRWSEIGRAPPAPLVPQSLIGWKLAGKGIFLTKPGQKQRGFTKEERDFSNFWGKVAIDPYRKQSTISKVAGGVLKIASVALPAFALAESAADAGNMGLQLSSAKSKANADARAMAPALAAQTAQENADFQTQLTRLQALAPQLASPAVKAQNNFAAFVTSAPKTPPVKSVSLAKARPSGNVERIVIAGFFAVAAFMMVRR